MSWLQIFVLLSELLASILIVKLWRSDELLFFKIAYSLIVLIPFLGPFIVLWSANMPPSMHPALRDKDRYRTDVLDRWRDVLAEKNPHTRYHMWRDKMNHVEKEKK
jgi:hypothetical protein